MSFRVMLWLLLSACGSSFTVVNLSVCTRIEGVFSARSTRTDTTGTCGAASPYTVDTISFTAAGFESPLTGVVSCTTQQNDCAIEVACVAKSVQARGQFKGTLSADGDTLSGAVTAQGDYRGCEEVTYDVIAMRVTKK